MNCWLPEVLGYLDLIQTKGSQDQRDRIRNHAKLIAETILFRELQAIREPSEPLPRQSAASSDVTGQ